jgi:5-deoxy-glucuronate isomerase
VLPSALQRRAVRLGPEGGTGHDIRASDAGWSWVGFAEHRLLGGHGLHRQADDHEVVLLVLEGVVDVWAGGHSWPALGSRASVFEGPPPVLLIAPGQDVEVEARSDATVIVADAPGGDVARTELFEAGDIRVETRGRGATERRIHHLLPPTEPAGRLILFEVITPGGNWSSYPPHKHDTEDPPREAYLEELYYYRFAAPAGWAFARVYAGDGTFDEAFVARDRDVVLVLGGYHPVAAAAGYDAYYLNVMAGPHRAWHFTLDPDHAWLMDWDPAKPGPSGPRSER